jgi:hypothetical protein
MDEYHKSFLLASEELVMEQEKKDAQKAAKKGRRR